jgi:hypothetical protein
MGAAGSRLAVWLQRSRASRASIVLAAVLLGACAASEPLPAKLTAPAAPPLPAPKPLSLVGMDSRAVVQALGQPALERQDQQAQYWLYSDRGCTLALFLYLDPETGTSRVTYYEVRRPGQTRLVADDCGPVLARPEPMAPTGRLPEVATP